MACICCDVLVEFCELSKDVDLYSSLFLCAECLEKLYSCKIIFESCYRGVIDFLQPFHILSFFSLLCLIVS